MKLSVLRTTIKDGNFTKEKKYYPNLKKEEINLLYKTNITRFFQKAGENRTYTQNIDIM